MAPPQKKVKKKPKDPSEVKEPKPKKEKEPKKSTMNDFVHRGHKSKPHRTYKPWPLVGEESE